MSAVARFLVPGVRRGRSSRGLFFSGGTHKDLSLFPSPPFFSMCSASRTEATRSCAFFPPPKATRKQWRVRASFLLLSSLFLELSPKMWNIGIAPSGSLFPTVLSPSSSRFFELVAGKDRGPLLSGPQSPPFRRSYKPAKVAAFCPFIHSPSPLKTERGIFFPPSLLDFSSSLCPFKARKVAVVFFLGGS